MFSYWFYKIYFLCKKDKIEKKKIFSFEGYKTYALVTNIYDGDTFTIAFRKNGTLLKVKCRAYGYDSPEMRPSLQKPNRDKEIEEAKNAKNYLIELLQEYNNLIYVELLGFDKYGRTLIKFYTPKKKLSINELMIKNTQSKPYFGGKKENHF